MSDDLFEGLFDPADLTWKNEAPSPASAGPVVTTPPPPPAYRQRFSVMDSAIAISRMSAADRVRLHPYQVALTTEMEKWDEDRQTRAQVRLEADPVKELANRQAFGVLVKASKLPYAFKDLSPADLEMLLDMEFDDRTGLGPLAPLWRDDRVSEIIVDSFDSVVVETNGRLINTDVVFWNQDHAKTTAKTMADKYASRSLSAANPAVSINLTGSRAHFVIGDIVASGVSINIRKFGKLLSSQRLMESGAFSAEMQDFMRATVRARATQVVSGGTGAGKTTVLNALMSFVDSNERLVTVEDARELKIEQSQFVSVQSLETKEVSSGDDSITISQEDLLHSALRMRPDRIIVGEVRTAPVAATMLSAASTGHEGTMTSVHADDPAACLNVRMVDFLRVYGWPYPVAVNRIAGAIDFVIQVIRDYATGIRYISQIAVVDKAPDQQFVGSYPVFTGSIGPSGTPVFRRHVLPDTLMLSDRQRAVLES